MKAQIVLTPAESKMIIAKAVVKLPIFKKALKEGLILLGTSTTVGCIYKELFDGDPGGLACGLVSPKGFCINSPKAQYNRIVINKGKLEKGDHTFFRNYFEKMSSNDIFIKGANAIDYKNRAWLLFGTKNKIIDGWLKFESLKQKAQKQKFKIIIPIGLEKTIPTHLERVWNKSSKDNLQYSTGLQIYHMDLLPGKIVTEIEAFKKLAGVSGFCFAAGGILGAEGSVALTISGSKTKIDKAIEIVRSVKGKKLSGISIEKCSDCDLYQVKNGTQSLSEITSCMSSISIDSQLNINN